MEVIWTEYDVELEDISGKKETGNISNLINLKQAVSIFEALIEIHINLEVFINPELTL
jgi:hypothetical protein